MTLDSSIGMSDYLNARERVLALTMEQRQSLTWEEADKLVLPDPWELRWWSVMKKRCQMPWQALARMWGIDP
jgi:hypothetical protein